MQILDNFLIMAIHVVCFIAGMKIANYYNDKAKLEQKDALEKQFLRLNTRMDADDPCKPYLAPPQYRYGDLDGDDNPGPISQEFMDELKETGRAKTSFRKSDVS